MNSELIVLAGATGDLGLRIARELQRQGAHMRAIVRHSSMSDKVDALRAMGVVVTVVNFDSSSEMTEACVGGSCVVSALSGLREVIVDAQTALLNAAVSAGVRRFIPSDFSIDFTKLPPGTNRNLDLRREFHERLDNAPVAATSILNGGFTELLTGQAPMILFRFKRVVYWEDADQRLDFTTMDDTARFTAAVALDSTSPRFLRIAGEQISAREIAEVTSQVTGKKFRLFRAGSLKRLQRIIKITRAISPQAGVLYPPWQGMQYFHNMFSGLASLQALDNDRYGSVRWAGVRDVLEAR